MALRTIVYSSESDWRMADIELVKDLVVTAGKRALALWGDVAYDYKADQSLVTEVDTQTERFLSESLAREYPEISFLGEEFGLRGLASGAIWACDPIDGTTNFVFGLPHWGVSVGLIEHGVPTLGAVYLPVFDELYWAEQGKGAFCNGRAIPQANDRESLHPEDTLCLTSNAMKTLDARGVPSRLRCLGSIAAELVYTARGNLCATVGLHEGIVDMAASLCIGAEVSCTLAHLSGPPVDIGELTEKRRTDEHFVFAPPRLTDLLQRSLVPRLS